MLCRSSSREYSDDTAGVIDEEVEKILRHCEEQCEITLTEHRNALDLVARALLEHETISGAEVHRLVDVGRTSGTPSTEPVPLPPPATPPVPTLATEPTPNGHGAQAPAPVPTHPAPATQPIPPVPAPVMPSYVPGEGLEPPS